AVTIGARTLKDAINEALRDWVASVDTTHYLLGTVTGPAPFPEMVRYFHQVIGDEAREQSLEQTGKLPDAVIAFVGGGSNAIGPMWFGVLSVCPSHPWQAETGQTADAHSIGAGLYYPAGAPPHPLSRDTGRAIYQPVSDSGPMHAFKQLTRPEGIMPPLESSP